MKSSKLAIQPKHILSPISLPERRSGKLSVRHRTLIEKTPVVGLRQAILRGVKPVMLMLNHPLIIHELRDSKFGTWMTDIPEELFQIAEAIAAVRPRGRVLVGGLGLGILPALLMQRADVKQITVIERSADVIKLCRAAGYEVIRDDLFKYLKRKDTPAFDTYMLDIWQMTGECEWWDTILPLRRLIRNRWGARPKIWCWAEDIMRGQIIPRLLNDRKFWKYSSLPLPMTLPQALHFVTDIGCVGWEEKYGKLVAGGEK